MVVCGGDIRSLIFGVVVTFVLDIEGEEGSTTIARRLWASQ